MSKEAIQILIDGLKELEGIDAVETELINKLVQVAEVAKQEQGEPVAWMSEDECTVYTSKQVDGCFKHDHIPLYTTPQQRKPLTWIASKDQLPPVGERVFWFDERCNRVGYDTWVGPPSRWIPSHWMRIPEL